LPLRCFADVAIEQNEFLKDCLIDASIAVKRAIAINFGLIDGAL
jgi:hypothetical protein